MKSEDSDSVVGDCKPANAGENSSENFEEEAQANISNQQEPAAVIQPSGSVSPQKMYSAAVQTEQSFYANNQELENRVLKIIAMGLLGKKGYLYDIWNKLDCFIVVTGFLEYLVKAILAGSLQLTILKILQIMRRILRPLRAVNRVPAMRVVAGMVLKTVPMLTNVLLLCFLIFFIFGLIAVQLWAGLWRNRCVITDPLVINFSTYLGLSEYYTANDEDYVCSKPVHDGMHTCHELTLWNVTTVENTICNESVYTYPYWRKNGLPSENPHSCIDWNQYYDTCVTTSDNLFDGALNFDNIFRASVTIFIVITMAGWTEIMYYVQDAYSFWALIYFVPLVVIGSIFTVNLFLVVITTRFSSSQARELTRMEEEKQQSEQDNSDADSSYVGF